jgi:hypothetical protein
MTWNFAIVNWKYINELIVAFKQQNLQGLSDAYIPKFPPVKATVQTLETLTFTTVTGYRLQ